MDFDKAKSDNLCARPYDDSLLKKRSKENDARDDLRSLVFEFGTGFDCIVINENMYSLGVCLLKGLGKERPLVLVGGVFPTFAPELVLESSEGTIDYILMGEGEETLPEFCRCIERNKDIRSIPGLCMKVNGSIIINPITKVIDINKTHCPDYSLFDDGRFYRPMHGKLRRMLPIETIRGCPFKCTYCNSPMQAKLYKKNKMVFLRKKRD